LSQESESSEYRKSIKALERFRRSEQRRLELEKNEMLLELRVPDFARIGSNIGTEYLKGISAAITILEQLDADRED